MLEIAGINYESASEYCRWLTTEYNSDTRREYKKVLFRLPTEEQWTFAANGGDKNKTYTWNSPYLLDPKNGYMCNFLSLGDNFITYDPASNSFKVAVTDRRQFSPQSRPSIPAPVNSYSPNEFGNFNMCGNVAEMVQEKGIAKGGSYNDPGYDVRIASVKHYTSSSVQIGFRVAMEIVEK